MVINIQSHGFSMTSALKEFVETRLRLAMARHTQKISRVDVTLLDVNGPKGGLDKRCRARLKLERRDTIVIQETDSDMYEAINSCICRLKRTLRRRVDRTDTIQIGQSMKGSLQPELVYKNETRSGCYE